MAGDLLTTLISKLSGSRAAAPPRPLILWDLENCSLPKALWSRNGPTEVTKQLEKYFCTSRGLGQPHLYLSIRDVHPQSAFSKVLAELTTATGWRRLGFQAKHRIENGVEVAEKNHTADFQLHTFFDEWVATHEQEGGLVIFITSDADFLRNVQCIKRRPNFSSELLYYGPNLSAAAGMRDQASYHCEWLKWLQEQLNMPDLQMQRFDKADYFLPAGSMSHGRGRGMQGPHIRPFASGDASCGNQHPSASSNMFGWGQPPGMGMGRGTARSQPQAPRVLSVPRSQVQPGLHAAPPPPARSATTPPTPGSVAAMSTATRPPSNLSADQTTAASAAAAPASAHQISSSRVKLSGFPPGTKSLDDIDELVEDIMVHFLSHLEYKMTPGFSGAGQAEAFLVFESPTVAARACRHLNGRTMGRLVLQADLQPMVPTFAAQPALPYNQPAASSTNAPAQQAGALQSQAGPSQSQAPPADSWQHPRPAERWRQDPNATPHPAPQQSVNASHNPMQPPPSPPRGSFRPTSSQQAKTAIAVVQSCPDWPDLIKRIYAHMTGAPSLGPTDWQQIKIQLSCMQPQVLFNTTGFQQRGEVILHHSSHENRMTAKRLVETFFKSVEQLSAKDVTEPLLVHYPTQQLMFLQKCRSNQLQDIAAPHGIKIRYKFSQDQRLQMLAIGKPVNMNDFLSSFEDKFGQPTMEERTVQMRVRSLSPVGLGPLPNPPKLLDFGKRILQFAVNDVQKTKDVLISINPIPRQQQAGSNPVIMHISIVGQSAQEVEAAEQEVKQHVAGWRSELMVIPPGQEPTVHRFVADYIKQVQDCFMVILEPQTGPRRLVLTCTSDENFRSASEAVNQVLVDVRPITKSYKPEEEKLAFLVRSQPAIWLLLTTFAHGQGVQLRYDAQGKAFTIAGPGAAASKVFSRLQQSCSEVEASSTTVDLPLLPWQAPWLTDDRTSKAAQGVLQRIAKQHAVWWETSEQQAAPAAKQKSPTLLRLSVNGHVITVLKKNIVEQTVSAIVNAANPQLWHSGGVAEHICRAAGPSFQQTCHAAVAAHPGGKIDVGSCLMTDAGELPCIKVIHAVGPNFHAKQGREVELLRSTYESALAEAANNNFVSIALPLISSGIFGCPVQLAANVAAAAVTAFLAGLASDEQACLKEVRFADIGDESVMALVKALKDKAAALQLPVQEHPDFDAALLDSVEFEYVNGMEWGFHCKEDKCDIAYSIGDSINLEKQYQQWGSLAPANQPGSVHRHYKMMADPAKYPEGMFYQIDLSKMKQKNTVTDWERAVWRRPAPADKIAGAAAARAEAAAALAASNEDDNSAVPSSAALLSQVHTVCFYGTLASCTAAKQSLETELQNATEKREIPVPSQLLSEREQDRLIEAASLLQVDISLDMAGDPTVITLQGVPQRVHQAEQQCVERLLRAQTVHYPDTWREAQSQNSVRVSVALGSPEIARLVQDAEQGGGVVLQVDRIQNKVLYQNYDANCRRISKRWAGVEPELQLSRRLWHGTRSTDPSNIFDSEEGFSVAHSAEDGMWGKGTYFSTTPDLAKHYAYTLPPEAAVAFDAPDGKAPVRQLIVADVLTAKSKMMAHDNSLRLPPELEDASLVKRLGVYKPRYDSVAGIHPFGQTPIFVTYTSAATSYPSYLVTMQC